MLTRRSFIATTALASGVVSAPALGFTPAESNEQLERLYAQSCAARGTHQALLDEVAALLQKEALAADLRQRLARGEVRCPFCDCAVTVPQ